MNLSIDVVIPTYDHWDLTESCLRHLREQMVRHSVIVVDSGSTDGTPSRVRSSFPEARVVELAGRVGFPVACNRGAAAGAGDVVVLLNNDVEVRPDFLEQLVRPLLEDAQVGSAAALLVQPSERTIDSMGLTADATLAGFPRLRGHPVDDARSVSPVLTGPSGAAGAYRRAAWQDVGGLDEGVLFYGEDLDLALRIRTAGWATVSAPDAVGVHLGSATIGHRSSWQRYQAGFARGYFLRRYRVLSSATVARTLVTESIVVAGDAALGRDLSALRGRLAGWRAARHLPAFPTPPLEAVDLTIGLVDSLRLRRVVYGP